MIGIAQHYGLTVSELNTIYELNENSSLNVTEIAQRVGLSKAAASQMIERLVRQGLLERSENPVNRREKRIRLTPAAQAVKRQVDEAILERMAAALATVPEAKIEQLSRALQEVLEELEARSG
ncbi:MAG: hypothetical protein KatS3mg071_2712 [Meiothermus sp.]|nr:MAG: hypothetical protein KatS3mg071_2712 [Meiothermus sp.]